LRVPTPLNKKSLHAVVDHLLRQGGQRIAIEEADRRIDYAELDARSRALGHALKARGVGPGAIVALPLPACIDYVVALFATVRAGGVFMPLDPAYPETRLRQIFQLARPQLVLVRAGEDALAARLAACNEAPVDTLTIDAAPPDALPELPLVAGDDDTGYLIHTSGSTGTPKLIAGRNKGISHFVHWEVGELGIDSAVRASIFSPPTFDVSLREIFVPLLAGGTLAIPDADTRADTTRLAAWLGDRQITLMHAVPSLFRLLTRALRDGGQGGVPTLRHACLAGEPLYGADVAAWRAVAGATTALINLYGPSETSLAKAFHRVDGETYAPGAIVPIGQPIANTALLLLRDGRLAEIGEIGEIHIRTPFASNGYWQDPARTAESFVPNPLADDARDRIYRTGDLGRYRADRSVEFVGRADRQVKIDGVRIELPEIEGALRAHPCVEEVAAHTFRLADGGLRLVGYYTAGVPIDAGTMRAHLEGLLPGAMIPGYLMQLPALPKNLNGKIDRKALPRPEALIAADQAYSAPQGPVETTLAALWADALGLDRIGVESPWVTAGGNSLRAIGLIGRINREFGVGLTIREFLEQGTIRAQAKLIAASRADGLPPLAQAPAAADYPVTDAQRRLWILSRLEDGQALYNNCEWLELRGPLDTDALRRAFQSLADRHEALRTVFAVNADGEPRQRIVAHVEIELPVVDLPADPAPALQAALQAERVHAFDLGAAPLMRLQLLRESPEHHHLLVNLHHIVCDGWSMGLLVEELAAAYRAACGQVTVPSAPTFSETLFQPKDVAVWLAGLGEAPLMARCRDYWRTQLADADERALLPHDAATGADAQLAGQVPIELPSELTNQLQALLKERQATPFAAVAAALAVLLQRYGGSEQVVIGTPVAGRGRPGMEAVVGFFVNTLPLVLRLAPELSFAALLAQAGRAVSGMLSHQDLPFDRLIADYGSARDPLRNPLFEVFLAAEPAPRDLGLPGIAVVEHEPPAPPARYDLTLRFAEDANQWRLILEYRASLWRPETMARFARHLGNFLAAAAAAPDRPIAELPMLDAAELEQLAAWSRGPVRPLPQDDLGTLFARQAARTPTAPALVYAEHGRAATLAYAELDRRADACAAALQGLGIAAGDVVGLLLPRTPDWPAAMLGILKAGAVALPLDLRHPPQRLVELLRDAEAKALIAPPDLLPEWRETARLEWDPTSPSPSLAGGETIGSLRSSVTGSDQLAVGADCASGASRLALGRPGGKATATVPPAPTFTAPRIDPDAPAYQIYTSGSTGTPKGVLVPHRAFANMILDQIAALGVGPGDRVLQFVAPAFDVAMFELFLPLLSGAALAIPDRDEAEDPQGYARWAALLGATVADFTPGFLHSLGDTPLPGIRLVVTGGEPPIPGDVRRCLAAGKRYVNAYGPTETAVNAAIYEVLARDDARGERAGTIEIAEPIPLGRPTANCALRVVAPDLTPLPAGVPGELLVAGAGVALGYAHRQALTERVFGRDADGTRTYRTGDRVRRDADGALHFLGRKDKQVKVRGHRIEPGEVEAAIKALPGVGAVRVVARESGADHELAAYWIATADATVNDAALQRALAAHLPAYAVPSYFVRLDRFPLTGNGKLDLSRLPDPRQHLNLAVEPPRNEDEARLVALWREVLELPTDVPLGRDSDFFALGGRSLVANRLALRVAREFGKPVSLRDIYAAPTPAGLLARLAAGAGAVVPQQPEDALTPLSPMQRRIWVVGRLGDSGAVYHIAGLTRLTGEFDLAALKAALEDLCTRQSLLRSRVVVDADGEPRLALDAPDVPPVLVETDADPNALAAQPFDFAHEWPLRVHLWQRDEKTWDLLLVLHHIAADGWSMPILARELGAAYNARHAGHAPAWTPLPLQYRDLAAWQAERLAAGAQAEDAAYWRNELAGELPLLDLPTDRPRPAVRRFQGATREQPLPATSLAALNDIAARHGTTPFTVFLALVQLLLARLARQDDVIVGVPVAGRSHPASEGMVGFFVNTLPLRARVDLAAAFAGHLAHTAARLVAAQQHQAYPFDRLVEDLDIPRDPARSPVFDVLVSLDEGQGAAPALTGLRATPLPLERSGSRCDLWWMIDLTGEAPALRVEYDSDLFDAATVADWSSRLLNLLATVSSEPSFVGAVPPAQSLSVGEISWLAPGEQAQILALANGPEPALPAGTVIDLFEAVAAAHAERSALIDDQGTLSYGVLDAAANRLAQRIAAQLPIATNTPTIPIIALLAERGMALGVAQLAVQKAGAAYLPIEPDSPAERVQALLADSGAALVLVSPGIEIPAKLPSIVLEAPTSYANEGDNPGAPPRQTTAADPIYVMYTSGSTGKPKGVVVPHRAVVRLVAGTDYYRPEPTDRLLQLSNYAFDGATFDFYAAWLNGLPLCLPDRETVLDTQALAAFVRRHGVNVSFVTTALFNRLVDTDAAVLGQFRRLYFGGQEASLPHVRRALEVMAAGALNHVYGPTEVTTFSTWHTVSAADLGPDARRLPIGRPIAHTRAYVRDPVGNLLPTGIPGELWLGGPGVTQGYLGQPELTAERFAASPYVAEDRLYRSGDLCVMRRDGVIEFLGRLDGQVKIRGYRVEIGEIEGRLAGAPGVGKVHVLARPAAGGNLELVAYLTAVGGEQPPTLAALHAHLSAWLPPYMIPAHFVLLETLPVNANGKVDRAALPAPDPGTPGLLRESASSDAASAAPRDAAETALHAAWRDALGLDDLGIRDNYFALGGDSIQALRIVGLLRDAGWTLKVTDLLRYPTVESLAPRLARAAAQAAAVVADDDETPPLSPIQHWFLAQNFANPAHFNQSILLDLPPATADAALQAAVDTLWRQHRGLRLVFGVENGQPWQRTLPADAAPCVERVACADAAALRADAQQRQAGFDTAAGPLLKLVRYALPDGDRLFLCAHHWIVDGVSWRTLLADLHAALAGKPLPPAGTSAGAWTRALAASERFDSQRDWWREQAIAPVAALPLVNADAPRSPLHERRLFSFDLAQSVTDALTATGHAAYQTQGEELLLAAWMLALARGTNERAFRLALESHGRAPALEGIDISRSVGWFTALFPLRFALSSLDLPTLIREVKETLRALPDRGVGYGVLRWLKGNGDATALAAAPEIGFNYLGRFEQDAALPIASEDTGDDLAPATVLPSGLDVAAEVRGDRLHVRLVADTARHPADWCEALAAHYRAALEEVAAHCLDPHSGALSPSDVDMDGLDLASLDAILDGLEET
jgi:amino acid adenylation domain-containing protein/non-ribosomal peptide synthase protein (TIGR01720 family)